MPRTRRAGLALRVGVRYRRRQARVDAWAQALRQFRLVLRALGTLWATLAALCRRTSAVPGQEAEVSRVGRTPVRPGPR
jgi:hypothetical protein